MRHGNRIKPYASGSSKRTLKKERNEAALKNSTKINDFFVKPSVKPTSEDSVAETLVNPVENLINSDEKCDPIVEVNNYLDIGKLSDNPSAADVENYVTKGPHHPISSELPADSENLPFPSYVLQTKLNNGESVKRDWMVYSPAKEAIYCFPCKLFHNNKAIPSVSTPSALATSGWDKNRGWRKLYNRIPDHEKSAIHKEQYMRWRQLEARLRNSSGIGDLLCDQIQSETEKWRHVLKCILDVVLTLSERSLAFQGDSDKIGDPNNGNFLAMLELLSRHDPILRDHINKVKLSQTEDHKKLQAHYLSYKIQNEFISLCSDEVKAKILEEQSEAKYYSILLDATPDVSHDEQHSFVIRYLCLCNGEYEVKERFLGFISDTSKTGIDISAMALEFMKANHLPIMDCRGQGYDNATNMSGRFNGVQKHIMDVNPLCTYSPCACHTLNLCGTDSVKSNVEFVTFFGIVQTVYTLFASSPKRWALLQETLGCSLHKQSGKNQ